MQLHMGLRLSVLFLAVRSLTPIPCYFFSKRLVRATTVRLLLDSDLIICG